MRVLVLSLLLCILSYAHGQNVDSLKRPDIYGPMIEMFDATPVKENDLVFLGNSITFWGNWVELSDRNVKIKNRGIPGDNTFGLLDRLGEVLKGKPAIIFLMIGINDLAQGFSDETILKNITKICIQTKSESPHTKLVLQSVLPVNTSFGKLANHYAQQHRIEKLNVGIVEISAMYDYEYIDLYSHFTDATMQLKHQLTWDGVHLTLEGYRLWSKILKQRGYKL